MKPFSRIAATALAIALQVTVVPFAHAQAPATEAAKAADLTDGEVRKIDRDARKITIRHGEIKSLDMPAMTMVFQLRDLALLEGVQAGDRVKFKVIKADSGYLVTELQRAK